MTVGIIHRDEWLAELDRIMAIQPRSGGLTMAELILKLGIGRNRTRRFLQQMQAQERLIVTWEPRPTLRGIPCTVPTYRIRKAVKGKAA